MRELKFRVWSKKLERFLSKEEYCLDFDGRVMFVEITENYELVKLVIMPSELYVIQQFTGLKDSKREEIYEGDLVNFAIKGITHGPELENIENAEVWYSEEDCMFVFGRFKMNDGQNYWYSFADRIDRNSIKVIGNIYLNNK